MEEAGDEHPDRLTGSIIFTVETEPHSIYQRRGHNLYTTETITLLESLVGFRHTIPYFGGHSVTLSRENVVTPSGFVQEILGFGLPIRKTAAENPYSSEEEEGLDNMQDKAVLEKRGTLYVKYQVLYPEFISAGQRESLKALLLPTKTMSNSLIGNRAKKRSEPQEYSNREDL